MAIKLVRYAIVGFLTLTIYLAVGHVVDWFEMAVIWQASLSFTAAVTVNYLLQKAWVFKDARPAASSLPKYVAMVTIGYMVNLLALIAFSSRMPLLPAQLTAVVLVVVSNAILSFSWVFLKRIDSTKEGEMDEGGSLRSSVPAELANTRLGNTEPRRKCNSRA